MSNKKLAILGVVAAVMLVWAVVQSKISDRTHKVTTKSRYLVTGVNVDDIDSIVVQSGKDKLTLKRRGSGFVIVNKDNYPAEAEKVNDLITDCLEVEVSQMVTNSPSNYEDLGVTEEKAQKVVHFLKPDGSELVGIIVGNTKDKGQGTYVRLTSNNEVFEASQAPWIETDPLN